MAEELIGYFNQVLGLVANAESFGTPLTNETEDELFIRRVDITNNIENADPDSGGEVTVTKRSARADTVGMGQIVMRLANQMPATGQVPVAGARSVSKSWVYPRGALVLKTGEKLHCHWTALNAGATADPSVDIQFHF